MLTHSAARHHNAETLYYQALAVITRFYPKPSQIRASQNSGKSLK
jgi:hypothetical protein